MQKSRFNLLLGFSASLIILVISSAASYKSIEGLLSSIWWVNHTSEVEQKLSTVESLMKDAETGQRGFLLTGRDHFLDPYQTARDSVWGHIFKAKNLTEDNKSQQVTFDTLETLIKSKFAIIEHTIFTKKAKDAVSVDTLERGKMIMDSIRVTIKKMIEREADLMVQRKIKFTKLSEYTPLILIGSSLLALIITIFFYRKITQDYTRNLKLEQILVEKDASLQRKIQKVNEIAKGISEGNYTVRVKPEDLE